MGFLFEPRRYLAAVLGIVGFVLLATMNAGGYRYGAVDQAFYIPAVLLRLRPELFPRDAALLDAQGRLILLDDGLAALVRWTPVSLQTLLLLLYLVTLVLLAAGAFAFSQALFRSTWASVAFVVALTLRHRITKTGVNTLEGYFHARVLVFAIGLLALAAWLRGRSWLALALAAASMALHPTIGLWFVVWIAVAMLVDDPRSRSAAALAGVACAAVGVLLIRPGLLNDALRVMDPAWVAVIAGKDYIFPTAWRLDSWIVNFAYAVVIVLAYRRRARLGLLARGERAVVIGGLALVAIFAASLPFIAARVALAVQMQISRVFWMADMLATAYVTWAIVEWPFGATASTPRGRRAAMGLRDHRYIAVAVLAAAALARGLYVMRVGNPERPLFQHDLPRTAWRETMGMIAAATPVDAHLLLDPGHGWREGTSARVAAERDVLIEETKDTALAFYSRDVAMRVAERTREVGNFDDLTPGRARTLAQRYDLDYLIVKAPMADLPLLLAHKGYFVYALSRRAADTRLGPVR